MPEPMPIGTYTTSRSAQAFEQFERVGRDALDQVAVKRRHEMIAALLLNLRRDGATFIEVLAGRHQLTAAGLHRGVLLGRIALGDDDHRRNAVARGGERDRLAVIAAGGGDEPFWLAAAAAQRLHIDQPAARLERSGRGVVLVLDHHLGADARLEERPGVGGGRRHQAADDLGGGRQFVERKKRHGGCFQHHCRAASLAGRRRPAPGCEKRHGDARRRR